MTKTCEVINLTPSDSGSQIAISSKRHGIYCTYRVRFCIKFLYIKFLLPATTVIVLQDSCVYSSIMYCSLVKSSRLIYIARSWDFRFTMLTWVRAKRSTGSSH